MHLSEAAFICSDDFLPLCITASGDQVQDRLFVATCGMKAAYLVSPDFSFTFQTVVLDCNA